MRTGTIFIFSLQPYTKMKVYEWSQVWVKGAGRPEFTDSMRTVDGKIVDWVIRQRGEDGSARVWPQVFDVALVYPGRVEELTVKMNAAEVHVAAAVGKARPGCVVFNSSGLGYGLFPVDRRSLDWKSSRSVTRAAMDINLYENMLNGRVMTPRELLWHDVAALGGEKEELDMNVLLDQIGSIFWHFLRGWRGIRSWRGWKDELWQDIGRGGGAE